MDAIVTTRTLETEADVMDALSQITGWRFWKDEAGADWMTPIDEGHPDFGTEFEVHPK